MTDEGLRHLQYAILMQAVADYGAAIQCGDLERIKELYRFFTSEWFEFISPFPQITGLEMLEKLTKINPKYLARCKEHYGR